MSHTECKTRPEPRYVVNLPVFAEWNEERTGEHIVTEGATENIGPEGAIVHLQQLPSVGSRIQITIQVTEGKRVEARAEVLRLVRDAQHPLASLNVVSAKREWRGEIWAAAAHVAAQQAAEPVED